MTAHYPGHPLRWVHITYIMIRISLCIAFALTAFTLTAQKGWEAGGWAGVSYYFGDLNTQFDLSRPGVGVGAIGRYNFNNRICFKLGVNAGNVGADDANSDNAFERQRNLSFSTNYYEAAGQIEFNFMNYTHGSRDDFFSPYLFAGFSMVQFNPRAQVNGQWEDLRPLGTEGQFRGDEYYTSSPSLLYGMGIKLDLSPVWSLNFELTGRRMFTDFLDDVSGVYPDMDDLESLRGETAVIFSDPSIVGPNEVKIGQPGRQRGDSVGHDSLVSFGVGLVRYFGDLECPSVSRRY